ncbi:hypothetical protein D3C78_1951400 [compost metagenome]
MFVYIGLALMLRAIFGLIGNLVFKRRRVVARARKLARTARVVPLAQTDLTAAVAGSAK